MKILFLLILLLIFYVAIIMIYSKKKVFLLNSIILIFIFMSFSINININVGSLDQPIYIPLLTFISFTVIAAFFTIITLGKKVKKDVFNKNSAINNVKKMVCSILLILSMLFFLFVQMQFVHIYNYSLYNDNIFFLINLLLLCIVFFFLNRNGLKIKQVLLAIVIFSLINSVLSYFQYIFNSSFLLFNENDDILYTAGVVNTKRVVGLVGASNGAGNLAAILTPILILYTYKYKSKIGFLAIILNMLFCILTFTRIAYLAIFVEIAIGFLIIRSKNKLVLIKKSLLFIFLISLSGLISYFFYDDIYKILFTNRGNTHSSRFEQLENIKLILSNFSFFGIGAGQYVYYLAAYFSISDIVIHSQLLNILVEQGLINLLLFTTFIAYLSINASRNIQTKWFIPIFMLGYLIVSNFNPNQYYLIPNYIFFITLFSMLFRSKTN